VGEAFGSATTAAEERSRVESSIETPPSGFRVRPDATAVKAAIGKIPVIGVMGAILKFGPIAAELLEKAIRPAVRDSAMASPAVREWTSAGADRTQIDEGFFP